MREFSKIFSRFWIGETGKWIKAQGLDCIVIALYLMTCPTANAIGLYYLALPTLSHETGIPIEEASKALRTLSEGGFCRYDARSEWVFIPNMARFQIGERLKATDNQVKWIKRELESVIKSPFYNDFLELYGEAFHLQDSSPFEGSSKPLRSIEIEIPTETATEKERAIQSADDGAAPSLFKLGSETTHRDSDRPSSPVRPKPRKPKVTFPDNWALTPALREYARENRRDPELEAERFKAHALKGDVRQCDWDQAFRSWILSPYGRDDATPNSPSPVIRTFDQVQRDNEARRKQDAERFRVAGGKSYEH